MHADEHAFSYTAYTLHNRAVLYKAESCLSVCILPRQTNNSAVSGWFDATLAQNESYVLWDLQVYF